MGACGSAAGGYDRQLLKCVREGDEFAAVDCLDRLRVVGSSSSVLCKSVCMWGVFVG
jgi:hypothetical protein